MSTQKYHVIPNMEQGMTSQWLFLPLFKNNCFE